MTTAITLTTHDSPAGPVLAVAGGLDHDSAEQLRTAVSAIALRPGQLLTIDLSGLVFCDSSGITALIAADHHTRSRGADLALAHVPPFTVRSLRLLGLDQVLRIRSTAETDTDPD